jgi:predicted DCC family thiol-disulfide oxidoreductase YuxK
VFPFRSSAPSELLYLFYDGDCGLCHGAVRFLLKRRAAQRFRFVPLQRLAGTTAETRIAQELGLDLASSIVLWRNGEWLARAPAVFAILAALGWPWSALLVLRLCPLFLSNALYDGVAKHRYRVFGRAQGDVCERLDPSLRPLLLDHVPAALATETGPVGSASHRGGFRT